MMLMAWEKGLMILAGVVLYFTMKVMDHYVEKDLEDNKEEAKKAQ